MAACHFAVEPSCAVWHLGASTARDRSALCDRRYGERCSPVVSHQDKLDYPVLVGRTCVRFSNLLHLVHVVAHLSIRITHQQRTGYRALLSATQGSQQDGVIGVAAALWERICGMAYHSGWGGFWGTGLVQQWGQSA